MEYYSRPSNRRLAQATQNPQNSTDQVAPKVDPQGLQQGQSIYDNTGKEFVVLENDPANTQKVIVPKDQVGQKNPKDVKQVEQQELTTTYQIQPPTARRRFSDKIEQKLKGGKGDKADINDFDLEQVLKGIKVEMEHTDDFMTALEIVTDHLTEDSKYYTKLNKMEKGGRVIKSMPKKSFKIDNTGWQRIASAIGYKTR